MTEKVFVTGAGIISATGTGIEATLSSLLDGKSGIGTITHLETEHKEFPAGEVDMSNAELSRMLDAGHPSDGLRTVLLGIAAAKEAKETAALTDEDLKGAIFVSGTTVGGMDRTEAYFKSVLENNADTDECVELGYNDCGCSSELIAEHLGKFKAVTTTSTACSSAANAIILGANLIKARITDIVVAGGAEALTKFHLNGFNTLMILDREQCRPFDHSRTGINLGEGAAYLVLESERSANRRQARILAEVSGYGNACDAFHQTASSENGEGAFLAMNKALEMSGLKPTDIDYINAHGTGTPNNDSTELAAMKRIWGTDTPPFSSTKSLTGHTTSASGSIEAVICLLALREGLIPKSEGFSEGEPGNPEPVRETLTGRDINHVINNSFGFGGNDSSIIFSKHQNQHG